MTSLRTQRTVAVGLAVCVVLVTALMSTRMVAHAAHHAHHKASTHGSAVCTWMCAAGQVLETGALQLPPELGPQSPLSPPSASEPEATIRPLPASRAPPFLSSSE